MSSLVIKDRAVVFPNEIDLSGLQDKFDILIVMSKLAGYSIEFFDYFVDMNFHPLDEWDKSFRLDFKYLNDLDKDFRVDFFYHSLDELKISFYYDGFGWTYGSNEIERIVKKIQEIIRKRI